MCDRPMKTFLASQSPAVLLFDIDNTLYRHNNYVYQQVDVLIQRLSQHRDEPVEKTRKLVSHTREQIAAKSGRKPSLGNTFVALGIPITTSVAWRTELMRPEEYLQADPVIGETLQVLARRFRLGAITNNPVVIGYRTLDVLGIRSLFDVVVGLDTTMHSKPAWEPFAAALEALASTPNEAIMVGDRYDVDLEPMICRGGSGILIESDEDLTLLGSLPVLGV
jgi:FMN phosphatase YigB (HAD superfamily)